MTTSIEAAETASNALTKQSKVIDSIDQFYADDCVFIEPDGSRRSSKKNKRAQLEGFFASLNSRPAKVAGEKAMRIGSRTAAVVVMSSAVAATLFFGSLKDGNAQTRTRYLPEYTADGQLLLPKNFQEWVYVGSPLTPNALNGGKAGFPEFHNVYIEPGSYEIYKKTGEFPEGTIFLKELQLTLPQQNPDGSRTEPSGRGYFPGHLNGADVTVKDSKRFAETNGWGYFNFNHYEPKAPTAKVRAKDECAFCHIANAKKDEVWTQFYPLLDK